MYLSMTRTLLLAVLAIPAGSPAQTDKRVRDLDTYTAQAVKDWGAPGLAISVVKDGRVVFAKGYGVLELGKSAPVDTQTLFAIGSTTKAMTVMALAMLVDERTHDAVGDLVEWQDLGTLRLAGHGDWVRTFSVLSLAASPAAAPR